MATSKIALWLSRRRHRLGFGVHSPFAFTLVRDVVRGRRCRYYRSRQLRFESRGLPHSMKRECALLFRLAARHHFSYAIITPTVEPQLQGAMQLASPGLRFFSDFSLANHAPTLIVANTCDIQTINISSFVEEGNIIYLRQTDKVPSITSELIRRMPGGWIMHDYRSSLFIPDPATPLYHIEVKLI